MKLLHPALIRRASVVGILLLPGARPTYADDSERVPDLGELLPLPTPRPTPKPDEAPAFTNSVKIVSTRLPLENVAAWPTHARPTRLTLPEGKLLLVPDSRKPDEDAQRLLRALGQQKPRLPLEVTWHADGKYSLGLQADQIPDPLPAGIDVAPLRPRVVWAMWVNGLLEGRDDDLMLESVAALKRAASEHDEFLTTRACITFVIFDGESFRTLVALKVVPPKK